MTSLFTEKQKFTRWWFCLIEKGQLRIEKGQLRIEN